MYANNCVIKVSKVITYFIVVLVHFCSWKFIFKVGYDHKRWIERVLFKNQIYLLTEFTGVIQDFTDCLFDYF